MVVRVADVVALGLLTDDTRAHVEVGHQVGRTEHQCLDPGRSRDGVEVRQAASVFDLRVNPDSADR